MADDISATDLEKSRRDLLKAALTHIPFDGWSRISLSKAARDEGVGEGLANIAFPGGVKDLLDAFVKEADSAMLAALEGMDRENMRIRERVTAAVRARIEAVAPHAEAERKALSWLALPQNAPWGVRWLARTVDLMWRAVGDTSTDFSFYTKRAILGGVYSSTLLYWLNDHSDGHAATWAFLDRRIDNVMQFEKAKARMKKAGEDRPSLAKILARLRYPSETRMKP